MIRLIKWALRIVVLAVVAVVLLLVFRNDILRLMAEHQIRSETGMDVKIGHFTSGMFSPVVTIEDLKLYNTPEFGGTEFLIIPELHMELDPQALADQKLRIKLLRINLGELDVVRNLSGETNILTMFAKMPKGKIAPKGFHVGGKKLEFEGVDMLNLSLGRMRYLDLKHPEKDREIPINLENQVFPNVKTEADLEVVMVMLYLRSGGASLIRPGDLANDLLHKKITPSLEPVERPAPAHN